MENKKKGRSLSERETARGRSGGEARALLSFSLCSLSLRGEDGQVDGQICEGVTGENLSSVGFENKKYFHSNPLFSV